MSRYHVRGMLGIATVGLALIGFHGAALAQTDDATGEIPGAQVLTRGPIHEAFAEPALFDPKPGPIVPKEPPQPIEELPPPEKPQGDNVQWIPGYWSWDDTRKDFVWVSGVWRVPPPGRQWVPGYWRQAEGGFQWVPGAWLAADQDQVQYLPPPPENLDTGPTSDPPSPDSVWIPGTWVWQDNRYLWQPGYWQTAQANWLWEPSHYQWTPSGYMYVNGYWDQPLAQRGMLFAPVYFSQPVYNQPNFLYSPAISLLGNSLLTSLFVRPGYGQYYFGDYYAPQYAQSGIYPWYAFHQSQYGYDPMFAYYNAMSSRTNPGWAQQIYQVYRYRRDHPEARPAPTYAAMQQAAQNLRNTNPQHPVLPHITLAEPASRVAASQPNQFVRIQNDQRKQLAQRTQQIHQFRQQRQKQEVAGAGNAPAQGGRASTLSLPKSPILAQTGAGGAGGTIAPPPAPRPPSAAQVVRLKPQGQPLRPQPNFETPPPGIGGGRQLPRERRAPGTSPGQPPPGQPGRSLPGRGFNEQPLPGQAQPGRPLPGRGFNEQPLPGQAQPGRPLPGRGFNEQPLPVQPRPNPGLPRQNPPGQGLPGQPRAPFQERPASPPPGQPRFNPPGQPPREQPAARPPETPPNPPAPGARPERTKGRER